VLVLILALLATSFGITFASPVEAFASTTAQRAALAQYWAPVHFQDVDVTGNTAQGGKSDYLTSYDYDGDLNALDNWDDVGTASLFAHMYYSVVETSSFSYIFYNFFHPRDWSDGGISDPLEDIDEHENDSEGALVIVQHDANTPMGDLKAVVTVAHTDFFSWVPSSSDFTGNKETVDGVLDEAVSPHDADGHPRPFTGEQAKTHAAWSALSTQGGLEGQFSNGDGVLYEPSPDNSTSEVPSGPNDRDVLYNLFDIFAPNSMWDQRTNPNLFDQSSGHWLGDASQKTPDPVVGDVPPDRTGDDCGDGGGTCTLNAATPPWLLADHDDGLPAGSIATDPAALAFDYFNWPGKPSAPENYIWNPYKGFTPPDPTVPAPSLPHNVMVVGDSISNGFEGDETWRYRLWQWAQQAGWNLDYVGPLTGTEKPSGPQPPQPPPLVGAVAPPTPSQPDPAEFTGTYAADVSPAFTNGGSAHYAMWGRQLIQDLSTITGVLNTLGAKGSMPDTLLVELGFNDIGWLGAGADLAPVMKEFIDTVRKVNPNMKFVLANVPQRTTLGDANPQLGARTTAYNVALAAEIPAWSNAASPVVMADFNGAYGCDPTASTCASAYDGLHPNILGEYRIASAFSQALHNNFGIGSAPLAVPTTVPDRPVAVPSGLVFDGTQEGVTATWNHVLGAHSYDVQWRDVTTDPNAAWNDGGAVQFNRFDLGWQFNAQPFPNDTYQVRARAVAGDADSLKSAWSAPVTGVAHPTTAAGPATLTGAAGSTPGSIVATWTLPAGSFTSSINEYVLWIYDTDTPNVFSTTFGYSAGTRTATVTGFKSGDHYTVFMDDWNAAGEGKPTIVAGSVIPQ
jgi:lysophospholipase L1-like esterase